MTNTDPAKFLATILTASTDRDVALRAKAALDPSWTANPAAAITEALHAVEAAAYAQLNVEDPHTELARVAWAHWWGCRSALNAAYAALGLPVPDSTYEAVYGAAAAE